MECSVVRSFWLWLTSEEFCKLFKNFMQAITHTIQSRALRGNRDNSSTYDIIFITKVAIGTVPEPEPELIFSMYCTALYSDRVLSEIQS